MRDILILVVAVIAPSACPAIEPPVQSMREVHSYLSSADAHTLALFDIDLVLLQPRDPAFQKPNVDRHREIAKRIMAGLLSDKREACLNLMLLSSESILVDTETPAFLRELSAKGVASMALTAGFTGPFAEIPRMEDWKIQRLQQLGIDFTVTAPHQAAITFTQFPTSQRNYPLYKKGILFAPAPSASKGAVLVSYLSQAEYVPSRIVFVDDRVDNIQDVEQALAKSFPEIAFTGIHFLAANRYPSEPISAEQFELSWRAIVQRAEELESCGLIGVK